MDEKKIRDDIDKVDKLALPTMQSIIEESFNDEEGILEIFKGVYSQAKKGSVPHASFIMQWYFKGGEDMPESKEFEVTRKIIK